MKLRSHLFVFGVGTVVPVLLVVAVLVWWTASLQRANAERSIHTVTRAVSLAVDRELRRTEAVLSTLATSSHFENGDFAALYRQAAALSVPGGWIALIRPDDVQVFNTLRPFGERLPLAVGMDQSWAVLRTHRTFVHDLFVGAIAQRPIIAVDVPVIRDGAVRYSLAMAFGPERFTDLLTEEALPAGWAAAVVDRHGATIAGTPAGPPVADALARDRWPRDVLATSEGWAPATTRDGQSVYQAWAASQFSGWRVVVAVRRSVVDTPVRRVLWVVLGAGSAFVVAVVGAVLVFSRRIGGAIGKLVQSADALGHGDAVERATPSPVRELDPVHRALELADRRLRERTREWETLLAEQAARWAAEQSAAASRASEERLTLALGVAKMGTWDLDLRTGRTIWSAGTFTVLGYAPTPDGVAPVDWWRAHVHPEDAERVTRTFDEAKRTGATFTLSHRILRGAAGETVWVDVVGRFFYDASGEPVRMLGALRDVSDQKRAEVAAHETATILAALTEATTDAIFVKDRQGRMLVANPATLRALGKTRSAVIGKTDLEFLGPERGRLMMENDRRVMETGREEIFEEFPSPGVTFLANKTPYRDAQGNVIGIIGIARDVTERKRVEAEREALRHQLEAVTSNATLGLFMTDEQHRCTYLNPAAEAMVGYTLAELRDRPFHEAIHHTRPDGRPYPVSECPIAGTIERGVPHRGEDVFVRRDGRFFPVAYAACPLRQDGRSIGSVLEVRDITAEKRAEAERADLLEREHRAREEAEAANRTKDEFLATLSHELRTPLNAMLGWIRLLRGGSLDEAKSRRALGIIERNVHTQTQLITDLLDVSRIISGKMMVDVRAVDFGRVVAAAVDAIRPSADGKHVAIATEIPEHCAVLGDATRLQQVVANLLSNAVKFTPAGGAIHVHLSRSAHAVHLVVTDTGKGIDPDFLPKIFDRFRQAESGKTREHSGLGLGLAIVRHLVELHGGTVAARSAGLGKGAEMRVDLPAAEEGAAVSEAEPVMRGDRAETPADRLAGMKIMVVDDNADTCDLLATLFTAEGAVTSVALSAHDALGTFERVRPDVLISDLAMPGMTGYDLVRRLRQRSRDEGGAVPAIALTAYARLDDRREALAAGFHAYLCKPVSPVELVSIILSLTAKGAPAMSG